MGSPKGRPKPKGSGGSRKGIPNKVSQALREMILGALDKAGGEKYLLKQANESPNAFLTLIGKILPTQVTGAGGGPIETRSLDPKELTDAELVARIMAAREQAGGLDGVAEPSSRSH